MIPPDADSNLGGKGLEAQHCGSCSLSCIDLGLLLLLHLQEKGSVDVGKDTAESDCGSDQSVQLFITTDSQLQVARSDALDLEILSSIACKFEDFGSQVFKDGGDVDGGCEGSVNCAGAQASV